MSRCPARTRTRTPSTKGETAGKSLNDSLQYSANALRGGAVVNQALLGVEAHDLSKLVGGQQKVFAALDTNEGSLKDLITNFNITMGALADESRNLRATIRELPRVLEAANPTLDALNRAFPPTRAWALEMIPGVRETNATLEAGFPWIRQTRALLRPRSSRASSNELQPAVSDFAEFTKGQVDFLPILDKFNRCQLNVILPIGEARIDDGALSTGLRNYQEFFQTMVGFSGESGNFDGNGSYTRFQSAGGGYKVQSPPIGRFTEGLLGSARAPAARHAAGALARSRRTSRTRPATSRRRRT